MRTLRSYVPAAVLILLSVVSIIGCGGSAHVPVEGKVTLDGKPLVDASVTLAQLRATDPGPYVGTTDADGRFVLGATTNLGGGVAPNEYRLMITTVKQSGGGMEDSPLPTQKEIVPPDYYNGTMKFTVPAGGTSDANFDLKSR